MEAEEGKTSEMDEAEYKRRLKVIKLESLKVKNEIKNFTPETVTEMHVNTFHERLKVICDKLNVVCETTAELILDLDEDNLDDTGRIQHIENAQETLRNEVLENEKKVGEKIKTLGELQPLSNAAKAKEESDKAVKKKMAEIDIEDVSEKVVELRNIVSKMGKVKDLKDDEIRENLLDFRV